MTTETAETITCVDCGKAFNAAAMLPGDVCHWCQEQRKAKWARFQTVLGSSMKLFWEASFDNYRAETNEQIHVVAAAKSFVAGRRGRVFVLVGSPGTGKTHIACALLREAIRGGNFDVAYWRMSDLMRRITGTWGSRKANHEAETLDRVSRPSLVVIDEVEKTPQSDWERNVFVPDLIDRMYAGRDGRLMLIGNLPGSELAKLWPESVLSRLRGMGCGAILECAWLDYRSKPKEEAPDDDDIPF